MFRILLRLWVIRGKLLRLDRERSISRGGAEKRNAEDAAGGRCVLRCGRGEKQEEAFHAETRRKERGGRCEKQEGGFHREIQEFFVNTWCETLFKSRI